jgi:hypothetical protein
MPEVGTMLIFQAKRIDVQGGKETGGSVFEKQSTGRDDNQVLRNDVWTGNGIALHHLLQ